MIALQQNQSDRFFLRFPIKESKKQTKLSTNKNNINKNSLKKAKIKKTMQNYTFTLKKTIVIVPNKKLQISIT